MSNNIGRLNRAWMSNVESNLMGSDTSLGDLVSEYANTDDAMVTVDGYVHNGRKWLDRDEISRLVAWVEAFRL